MRPLTLAATLLSNCHLTAILGCVHCNPWAAELLDLRQKFMEDRARIQELRAARNFKPF